MTHCSKKKNKSDVSEDELTKVFNELDDDGNGYITPREAKKAYKKLCERFNIKRVIYRKTVFHSPKRISSNGISCST